MRCSRKEVLNVLGYQGFPLGPILVREERIRKILETYGDIESFVDNICGETMVGERGFNPDKLFLPEFLRLESVELGASREEKALYLYGAAIEALTSINGKVLSETLWSALTRAHGIKFSREDKQRIFSALKNDLRRLCVVSIGSGDNWGKDVEAMVTVMGRQVLRCTYVLRGIMGIDKPDIVEFIGSLLIIYCLSKCCKDCIEEEAGVCLKLCKGEVDDSATLRLVAKAVEIAKKNMRLLIPCLPYGADVTALKVFMEKLGSSSR